jgi:hypothetical protein
MCSCMRVLLNLGSSRIELASGGYKLGSIMNGMSITPINGGLDHLL